MQGREEMGQWLVENLGRMEGLFYFLFFFFPNMGKIIVFYMLMSMIQHRVRKLIFFFIEEGVIAKEMS